MVRLEIACKTDAGARTVNEDSLLAKRIKDIYLLAVADGVSGQAAGEVASNIALLEIEEHFRRRADEEAREEILKEAIDRANKEVFLSSKENEEYAGMGTTIVMAVVKGSKAFIANTGDSRAYLFSKDQIEQLTVDHTVVQELLDKRIIKQQEIKNHPQKNVLTRALGFYPDVLVDCYQIELLPEDVLILCSDGLSDSINDNEIKEVVSSSSDLNEACINLIGRAKERVFRDNISVILAREKQD